jgi:hypothetical protein
VRRPDPILPVPPPIIHRLDPAPAQEPESPDTDAAPSSEPIFAFRDAANI